MKTLIISALVASAALTGAASAQVGSGAAAAIAHFNQDVNVANDAVSLINLDGDRVVVSSRSGGLGAVFALFNSDADVANDFTGQNGATLVATTPAYNADIFAEIERQRELDD
ncbi:hypothetical protein [Jannaschia sp. M317]|uniref:hypothetical protein n=1 Tax=Jannaschia sp. M317 TaxID=2867011 RepID=UPI0021A6B91E|nr:hypothetical protein [Jannaschia sp. M317]UWQ17122.1 hypothetical protein K3551_14695 [Jannaschia sp. M317]